MTRGLFKTRSVGHRHPTYVIGVSTGIFVVLTFFGLLPVRGFPEEPVPGQNQDTAENTNPAPTDTPANDTQGDSGLPSTASPGNGKSSDGKIANDQTNAPPPTKKAQTAKPAVQLSTVDASSSGPLDTLIYDAETQIVRIGQFRAPLRDVVMATCDGTRLRPATIVVYLGSGSELFVRPKTGDESDVRFESAVLTASDGTTTLSVPIEQLRALAVPRHFGSEARFQRFRRGLPGYGRGPIQRADTPPTGDTGRVSEATKSDDDPDDFEAKDVILTLEESRIEGLVASIGPVGVNFEADAFGKVTLDYRKICALTVAALDEEEAPEPRGTVLRVGVTFQDGSFLVGSLESLGDGALKLQSPELGSVTASLKHVRSIEVLGGRTQYLSDLDPSDVVSPEALFTPRPAQRDSNVLGGRLRMRGRTYRKGIGMLSKSRVTYELDDKCERFQAIVGMDDAAIPQSLEAEIHRGGIADFRILLDDKVAFEKTLSFRDEPVPVDLAIAGAKRVSLEVDYGPGFLVLDYADWADARFIRK